MNVKRLISAAAAVTFLIFLMEWFVHGVVLKPMYKEMISNTLGAWRGPKQVFFPALAIAQVIFSFLFVYLYERGGIAGKGLADGALFGLWMGIFFASSHLMIYAVQPIPEKLACIWILASIVESILAGVITAAFYRR